MTPLIAAVLSVFIASVTYNVVPYTGTVPTVKKLQDRLVIASLDLSTPFFMEPADDRFPLPDVELHPLLDNDDVDGDDYTGTDVVSVVPEVPPVEEKNIFRRFYEQLARVDNEARPGYKWITTASGRRAIVHERYAATFVGFIRDLEATGYRIEDIGGYSYRRIAGTRTWSKHAFGAAIDVNQLRRDVVSVRMDRRLVSQLAVKHGLCSGGDWRYSDLGHFEVCGRPSGYTRHAKATKSAGRNVRYAKVKHYRQQQVAEAHPVHDVARQP